MNRKAFLFALLVALALLLVASLESVTAQGPAPRAPGAAMGTAFTYQGQLKKSGSPVTSTCNFKFGLWNAVSGGTPLGSTQTINSVSVANGLFTATLNGGSEFGANAFNGDARWLAISVQCTGDSVFTDFTTRQPLTPAPYALALPGLYTQQNATSPNLIGGYSGNSVTMGTVGATIGGGGLSGAINSVTDDYGTVGGGYYNTAGGDSTTVGGGRVNTAYGYDATIGGGNGNTTSGDAAAIGGGTSNTASNNYATVGGGGFNTADGQYATVPGGILNTASGTYSFAAGRRAKANHTGAFVWGDSTGADVASTTTDQFVIRATNGVNLTVDAGPVKGVSVGDRYRDNAIVAWASIYWNGSIDKSFGVQSVTKLGTGQYSITLYASAASTYGLIPVATAEVDAAPTSAAALRIVSVNQINSKNIFEVYINDGTGALVDNDFVVIVTAR